MLRTQLCYHPKVSAQGDDQRPTELAFSGRTGIQLAPPNNEGLLSTYLINALLEMLQYQIFNFNMSTNRYKTFVIMKS